MSTELIEIEEVIKTISLDFARKTTPITVFAKQGDNNTRKIIIQPLLNGEPKTVGSAYGWIPYFAERKPDGHIVYNDNLAPLDDGRMLLTLTDQALASAGNAICCIVLRDDQTNEKLTSQNFILCIEYSPGAYENLASTDEIIGIDGKAEELQALIDTANETLGDLGDLNNLVTKVEEHDQAINDIYNNVSDLEDTHSREVSELRDDISLIGEYFAAVNTKLPALEEKVNALPTATASDNGKFLQVVDGTYALVALQDVSAEGA